MLCMLWKLTREELMKRPFPHVGPCLVSKMPLTWATSALESLIFILSLSGCTTFVSVSNIQTIFVSRRSSSFCCWLTKRATLQGIDLNLLNLENGSPEFNPSVPAPYADFSAKAARCWQGPCLNMCCRVNSSGSCTDNLVSNGGHYSPGKSFPVALLSKLKDKRWIQREGGWLIGLPFDCSD